MISKTDFDQSGWLDLLAASKEKTCDAYYTTFKQAAIQAREAGETLRSEVFRLLAGITSMWLDPSGNKDNPFHPMMTFTDGSRTMIVDDIGEEEIEMLAEIVDSVVDSEMQSRIADVLWIRGRNYQMAIRATNAYLASAKNLKDSDNWLTPTSWRLERAIQLAQRIRNQQLLGNIFSEIETTLSTFTTNEDLLSFAPVVLMGLMQKYRYKTSQPSVFASLAEKGAVTAANGAKWYIAREYWEVKARWHAETETKYRQAKIEASETYVKEAEMAANDTPSRYLAASAFIEDAIEAMRKIGGMQERVAQLQLLLIEYGQKSLDEMGEISIPIDLTRAAQKAQEQVRGKSLFDALFTLMKLGSSPSVADLENEARNSIDEHPVLFRVSSRTFNEMGKVVNRRETVDEDADAVLEDQMYQQAARSQDIQAVGVIEPAVYQIISEHGVRVADLMPLVVDNPFIPPGRELIYARGLHAGLVGDYLVAAHLLIPQIENSFRYILQQRGVITSGIDTNLIQDEYTLEKIIYKDELKDIFGDDIIFDLKGLLVKRAGSNSRNLTAHGLMTHDEFYSARMIYLWWLILRLWCLPKLDFLLRGEYSPNDNSPE